MTKTSGRFLNVCSSFHSKVHLEMPRHPFFVTKSFGALLNEEADEGYDLVYLFIQRNVIRFTLD